MAANSKTLIYLANLSHVNKDGIPATETIPLNLGYLASYAEKVLPQKVEIALFNLPGELADALRRRPPAILAGSNYSWNSNINYHYLSHAKKLRPETVTVMGGPTFSYNPVRRREYLENRPHIDFYISDEGEVAFAGLVSALINNGMDIGKTRAERPAGCHFLEKGELVSCPSPARLKDINAIPSPYLNGMLDGFLEKGFTPILQSNRGCPFKCAYCCSSVSYYNKISFFDVERVKGEIEHIALRVKSPSIHIHDDNFGMFTQDYEICKKFKEMQDKHKWPVFISAATGKNSKEKILKCVELLGPSMPFSASVQTTSSRALELIGRDNISFDDFMEIQKKLKELGANSHSELILPLPGETVATHLEGIKMIMDASIDSVGPYTTMVLPASPLMEDKRFEEEKLVLKYRVVPRDFGKYEGDVVVEAETVCVATRDMSIEEYVMMRKFHFIVYCFYNGETFKELINYMRGVGCSIFEFCRALLDNVELAPPGVRRLFEQFVTDTRDELWDREEDIHAYFSSGENYKKLETLEKGANLLQKYNGIFFSSHFSQFCGYSFERASSFMDERNIVYEPEALLAIQTFIMKSRSALFDTRRDDIFQELPYDIPLWKKDCYARPLSSYRTAVKMRFVRTEHQAKTISDYLKIYGDTEDGRGKILVRVNPKVLFREVVCV